MPMTGFLRMDIFVSIGQFCEILFPNEYFVKNINSIDCTRGSP